MPGNLNAHTPRRLHDECDERDDIHAPMVLRDVHNNLQEQRGERDAGAIPEVCEDREERDDSEDDRSRWAESA